MVDEQTSVLKRLRFVQLDGRLGSVRYRQSQLQGLQKILAQNSTEIRAAIQKDYDNTPAEVDIEFTLALNAIRDHYESLNFDELQEDEYRIARLQDNVHARIGVGMVFIKPGESNLFYSILSPLSAAIAAGNCTILELGSNLSPLRLLLARILSSALDTETFSIMDQEFANTSIRSNDIRVLQSGHPRDFDSSRILGSPSTVRVIAVVDRTANLNQAAENLIHARFSFRGKSVYAPDIVLVNEFVKKRFLELVAKHAISYSIEGTYNNVSMNNGKNTAPSLMDRVMNEKTANILSQGSKGSVVEITSRTSFLTRTKITEPILSVLSISSLDDAIDLANSTSWHDQDSDSRYLASYIFADAASAKYVAQFIRTQASLVNFIPIELLVGPAAPLTSQHALNVPHRYTPSMFQRPNPQFVAQTQSTQSQNLTRLISVRSGSVKDHSHRKNNNYKAPIVAVTSAELVAVATQPLKSTQPLQHARIGFFEQGILVGLAVVASPVVIGLGYVGTKVFFG